MTAAHRLPAPTTRVRLILPLVLGVVVLAGACGGDDRAAPGPLVANDPRSSYAGGLRVNVGEIYSFSDVLLHNRGDGPLRITGVTLVSPQHIELVGSAIGVTPGSKYPSGARGFPPPYPFALEPAVGAEIPPTGKSTHETILILGLRADQDGISSLSGIVVTYQDAVGSNHELLIRYAVSLCAPRAYFKRHLRACKLLPAAESPSV